jgi:CheY-like chemotaxis protein
MICPRCQTTITSLPDPDSIVTCPGCGSRLMTRAAAIRSQGGKTTAASAPPAPGSPPASDASAAKTAAPVHPADLPPSATLPPTPAMMLGLTRPAPAPSPAPSGEKAGKAEKAAKGSSREEADAEKPKPGKGKGARAGEPRAEPDAPDTRLGGAVLETLDLLLAEIRVVRSVQEDILATLRVAAPAAVSAEPTLEEAPALTPIRVRRRKTVVLIDDDPKTREAAVAELHQSDVPVRACADGKAALAAIAEDKPDVVVLEHTMEGDTSGRDVINMIKATIEWVDIPIVLWTREDVASQKDARLIHGADEVVLKSSGAQALLARVITVFRRG